MLPRIDGGFGKLLSLLSAGVPVSEEDGYSPVVVASARGSVKGLGVEYNEDIPLHDINQSFMAAASSGALECMKFLQCKSKSSLLDVRDHYGRTALFYTLFHDQFDCFLYLVQSGANLNLVDYHLRSFFHVAAYYGRIRFVDHLLSCFKDTSRDLLLKKDKYGCTSFHYAVVKQHENITESFLSLCPDDTILNEKDNKGLTILQYACLQKENEDWVEYLLDEGCDMTICDSSGHSPLHHSIITANHEVIKTLLMHLLSNKSFDELYFLLNQKSLGGYTPLHYAILTESVSLFKVLISSYKKSLAGSKQEISLSKLVDDKGRNIFHMAAFMNHVELCKLVLHFFPTICPLKDTQQRNALFFAVRDIHTVTRPSDGDNSIGVLEFLVSSSVAKLNAFQLDSSGRNILHYACYYNHLGQVKYILSLRHGASETFDVADNNGCTPLHVAAAQGHAECVRLLILMGSLRMDEKDKQKRTPLHVAVQNMHISCTEVLIQLGASSTQVDYAQRTPLHYACVLDIKQSAISEQMIQIILQDSAKFAAAAPDVKGVTPLLLMSAIGNIRSMKEILYHLLRRTSVGAGQQKFTYPNSFLDSRQWSPMHFAAFHGHAEVLRMLLEYFSVSTDTTGPMMKWKNNHGMTPFHFACAHPSSSLCVKIFLENNIESDVVDKYGRTGLHIAAGNGNLATCNILLTANPNLLSICDNKGRYAAQYISDNIPELAELLDFNKHLLPTPVIAVDAVHTPGIRSTPRKLRKKSLSNITIRSRTPAGFAAPRPISTLDTPSHIPLSFTNDDEDDDIEIFTPKKQNSPRRTPKSLASSISSSKPKKNVDCTRNGTPRPLSRIRPSKFEHDQKNGRRKPRAPACPLSRNITSQAPLSIQRRVVKPSTALSRTPNSKVKARTPTRRIATIPCPFPSPSKVKTTSTNNKENQGRKKAGLPYSHSPHKNVFERLNAHAIARQEARKAQERKQ